MIKVDQTRKVVQTLGFSEEASQKYTQGVESLWRVISSSAPESPEYQAAQQKLLGITASLRMMIQKKQHESAQNAARQAALGQNGQAGPTATAVGQADGLQAQSQANAQLKTGLTAGAIEKAKNLVVYVPALYQAKGAMGVTKYTQEARQAYAKAWTRMDAAVQKLDELERDIKAAQTQGKMAASPELQALEAKKKQFELAKDDVQKYLDTFHENQRQTKQANEKQASQMANTSTDAMQLDTAPSGGQPHSVSSALDAARNQIKSEQAQRQMPGQIQQQQPQPQMNTRTDQPGMARPLAAPRQGSGLAGQTESSAYPLSHQDALQQARNPGTQATFPVPNNQPASHTHPAQPASRTSKSSGSTHNNMPVPAKLDLPAPQPVPMGPSRPTMTNGPHLSGPIGQPVIQKHPGYVLEGDSERVLSKKKLEDLVRQVTGEAGVEGETGESMTAEVEETLLQIADEFVDQVIVSACKLAKLRSSSMLEVRDIQLILERNYNIRVPGFASDELRAVRKVVPSSAWTQKLSAVQAAKVTGGKAEL